MNKLLTSKWSVAVLGMIAFLVTIVILWKPDEAPPGGANAATGTNAPAASAHTDTNTHAHAEEVVAKPPIVAPLAPSSTQAGEPGSLTFNNPELVQLRIELQQEKAELLEYEKTLKNMERQLLLEKEHLGIITQQVWQAKAALDEALTRERTIMESSETNALRGFSRVFAAMAPTNAMTILKNYPSVNEVARILHWMDHKEQAAILQVFGSNDVNKATEIIEKMRTLAPRPQLPLKK
ncbi:MAG: hypothetical protein FJ403_02225 [Verrucomicrobia bacterium]|nr:hypothetical protein [Verrucomicrobiota bacterium]